MVKPITSRTVVPPKPTFVEVEKKRRFNVALGLPEIHLRKSNAGNQNPARNWRIASFAIVILTGVAIFLAMMHPYFNIPSVTVLGNNRLTREAITNATGVIGQSIFTVQPQDVEMRLRMNYPELMSVDVDVYLPNHVYVTVTEREPRILWQHAERGAYTWIDETGVAFRPSGVVTGLIPVTGLANPPQGTPPADAPFSPPPFTQKELVEAIIYLAPNVPADTTLIYDGTYGLGWDDARGWRVFFGTSAHDMALKVRVYQSLAQSLVERSVQPTFINVTYPEAPYYRMAAEVEYRPVSEHSGQ
jgi:cell division septal protein FtsQ